MFSQFRPSSRFNCAIFEMKLDLVYVSVSDYLDLRVAYCMPLCIVSQCKSLVRQICLGLVSALWAVLFLQVSTSS